MKKLILSTALVTVLGLGGYVIGSKDVVPVALADQATSDTDTVTEIVADTTAPVVEEMVLGDENAPITVIEYASYTCVHCANFHEEVFPQLKVNFIETGKVKFIFREVYFNRDDLWASMIARCGGSEKFFGINDLIFSQQSSWIKGASPEERTGSLLRLASQAGLSDDTLNACLKDDENAKALVEVFQNNIKDDGVESTPTLFINGEKYNNMSYEKLAETLNAKLAK